MHILLTLETKAENSLCSGSLIICELSFDLKQLQKLSLGEHGQYKELQRKLMLSFVQLSALRAVITAPGTDHVTSLSCHVINFARHDCLIDEFS
jgi:hypothetical protein